MSDSLTDLPLPINIKYTDEEKEAHALFASSAPQTPPEKDTRYLILYASLLFMLLASPIADEFVKRLPYCDGELYCLIAKTLLFAIGLAVIYYFIL